MSDISLKESEDDSSTSGVDREQWLPMYQPMFPVRSF